MSALLALSRFIDRVNERVGHAFYWLILATVLVSAANAVVRKVFNYSSNAYLEIQWYLFSAIFLFCAGYTLLRNEHVRIDVIAGRLSARAQAWIDLVGSLLFLLPMALIIGVLAWPEVADSFMRGEMSGDAGGLLRWPVKLLIPLGFALLALQGVSELIKRIAFLAGRGPDPAARQHAQAGEPSESERV